jgi:putative flippase GtrA
MSKTRGELLRFLVVGVATVLIDLAAYRLTMAVGLPTGAAKATGFLTGTVFAYFANRMWTFAVMAVAGNTAREVLQFATVYGGSLIANVGVNGALLAFLGHSELALAIALVIATGVSALLNFLGMKFLVFRSVRA